MKPVPRSGSLTSTRASVSAASPSSSWSPSLRFSASSTDASTQAVPGAGMPLAASPGAPAFIATINWPRKG